MVFMMDTSTMSVVMSVLVVHWDFVNIIIALVLILCERLV